MSSENLLLEHIRAELGDWLDKNWRTDRSLTEWREILLEAGWAATGWPTDYYGRGYTASQVAVVEDTFKEKGALGAAVAGPVSLATGIILSAGTDEQKQRFLKPLLTGQQKWCQLFSEPGSGSDLAGLSTKAEFVDGRWIVNGQKVWTTSAHHADYGLLLARTNWDVPKHQGISYFLFDMHQPGVEVRPLKQMNGYASFNEVFITDAVVEPRNLIGQEGQGWDLAKMTLTTERQGFVGMAKWSEWSTDRQGRIYDEYRAELEEIMRPYVWYPQRAGRVDLAISRARETGAIADPVIRQEIARLICLRKSADIAAAVVEESRRAGSDRVLPVSSVGKLAASAISRQAAHVHTHVSGTDAMFRGEEAPLGGLVAEIILSTPAMSIAGGTDEIQKNIVSEGVLGMPKETRVDTGPFRSIKRNSA